MPEIGESLREARMRARIDVSEIEAKTKIRAKYLRALENEEWGLLPGPTFVKSFLRTYAQALGRDAKALVEEYRLRHESPGEPQLEPIVPAPRRERGPGIARGGGGGGRPPRAFEHTLGNQPVTMLLDGTPRTVPASSKAIAYSSTKAGRHTLPAERQPTCT